MITELLASLAEAIGRSPSNLHTTPRMVLLNQASSSQTAVSVPKISYCPAKDIAQAANSSGPAPVQLELFEADATTSQQIVAVAPGTDDAAPFTG